MNIYRLHRFLALIMLCVATLPAKAILYETVNSNKDFTNPIMWKNGMVPPVNLNPYDTIRINQLHTVILDRNLTITHPFNVLLVEGTLKSGNYGSYLNVWDARIAGNGTIDVDSLYLQAKDSTWFTPDITARAFNFGRLHMGGHSKITTEKLYVHGNLYLDDYAQVVLGDTVHMVGGSMEYRGGLSKLVASKYYNVIYHVPDTTGIEILNSSYLWLISVDAGKGKRVMLTKNIYCSLHLISGEFDINGYTLQFQPGSGCYVETDGYLRGSRLSKIVVNTYILQPGVDPNLQGELKFVAGADSLYSLSINAGNMNYARLGSDLHIVRSLDLLHGCLHAQNHKLTIEQGASITGLSAYQYIMMDEGGRLEQPVHNGIEKLYPIGTDSAYLPAILHTTQVPADGKMAIGVNKGIFKEGATGMLTSATQPCVPYTWWVEGPAFSYNFDLDLGWQSYLWEVNNFNRQSSYVSQYTNGGWDVQAGTAVAQLPNVGTHSYQKRAGVTSLGAFAVVDDKARLSVQNISHNKTTIYPNPATDVLHIEGNTIANADAQIINAMGQKVKSITLQKGNNTISIAELPAGNYWLRLGEERRQFTKL